MDGFLHQLLAGIASGGIYGIVSEMEEGGTILLQIAEDVDIRIAQSAVARKTSGDLVAPAAQPAE